MRVSKEKSQSNRENIVETSSRLLREHGYVGIGVADLMKESGLTHGGFYRKFLSKEKLLVEASRYAVECDAARFDQRFAQKDSAAFQALISAYVSEEHCSQPGAGCILPALAVDAARMDNPELRAVFDEAMAIHLERLVDLQPAMPPQTSGRDPAAILAEMVGAIVLARAAGPHLAQSLIDAVVHDLAQDSHTPAR